MKFKSQILLLVILTVFFISCTKEVAPKSIALSGNVFGTTYKIVYLNTDVNYQKPIDSLFYLINKSLSTYMPTSDISKINDGDTTVTVDHLFKSVFKKSKRIYKETDGFFDPTVGNLVNAWGFGPKNEKRNLSEEEVKHHMKFVGLEKVSLINDKVVKEDSKIYLDFNSIAKGFGIDVVGSFLEDKKVKNYLVEIGGEIRARGTNTSLKPWKIGFDNPNTDGTRSVSKFINLSNKSMASSGNYRKFRVTKDGRKFVHTINPKTGFAIESNLISASVIANLDCADVDAYATAFMAMGLEKTKDFLKNHPDLSVILLYADKNGNIAEYSNLE